MHSLKVLSIALILALVCRPTVAEQKNVKKKPKRESPFAKVTDDPNLPRVLIIGDSISIGYTIDARKLLDGVPTNAGHTGMGLNGLPKWLDEKNGKWDVIHFNWGLWDLCYRNPKSKTQGHRDKVAGKVTHEPNQYAENLQKIVDILKKTDAELVFATTTPVPDKELGRKLGDDLVYNKLAAEVMKKNDVVVNDLHAAIAADMAKFQVGEGNVHFKPEGSKLLAIQVAKAVEQALKRRAVK
jgi:hypothetical protein